MNNLAKAIEQLATALGSVRPYAHFARAPFTLGYQRDTAQESLPNETRPTDWRRFTLRSERVTALGIGGLGARRYEAAIRLEIRYPETLSGELASVYFGAEIELVRSLLEDAGVVEFGPIVYGELQESELQIVAGGLLFVHRLLIHYDHSEKGSAS